MLKELPDNSIDSIVTDPPELMEKLEAEGFKCRASDCIVETEFQTAQEIASSYVELWSDVPVAMS